MCEPAHAPRIERRSLMLGLLALSASPRSVAARVADPISTIQPLKILIGFAAGTSPDFQARALQPYLKHGWPGGVVIDNRSGAGGLLALEPAGRAAPDGTTLLWASMGEVAINPYIYAKLPFNPSALVPVCQVTTGALKLITGSRFPGSTFEDWMNFTRNRQQLTIGDFGQGTLHHLVAVMVGEALKRNIEVIHYRSPGDMLGDLSSGRLDAGIASTFLSASWVKLGKIHILGTSGPNRSALTPEVPTFDELGMKSATAQTWQGFFAPPGTNPVLVQRIGALIADAAKDPDYHSKMLVSGSSVEFVSRDEFAGRVLADRARYGELIKRIGLEPT